MAERHQRLVAIIADGADAHIAVKLVNVILEFASELGISDIMIQNRDSYAIIPEKIPCDYYLALKRNPAALSLYEGEYMNQYEWALHRVGQVEREVK